MAKGCGQQRDAIAGGPLPTVDRVGHVNVHPGAWVVETQVSTNEQASTRTLGVAAILEKRGSGWSLSQKKWVWLATDFDRVLHVSHLRVELLEVQLRSVWQRKDQVP